MVSRLIPSPGCDFQDLPYAVVGAFYSSAEIRTTSDTGNPSTDGLSALPSISSLDLASETNGFANVIPEPTPDTTGPEYSDAAATASSFSVPPNSIALPDVGDSSVNASEIGAAETSIPYGGPTEILAPAFYQCLNLAALETSVDHVVTAYPSAALTGSFMANAAGSSHGFDTGSGPMTNASIGPLGATEAQVRQALDDSGLSVDGTGIKVGILSDSFNDLGGAAVDEADGALPSASHIQVLQDLSTGGTDEGRAMMQIIHDIAPGADLAFYTAFNSEQDFADGILALAAAGCKVIVDDVSYSDEPFFQNGVVAQAIETVESEGVTYVTAAGNDASDGYQAAWTPTSGSFDGKILTDTEDFGGTPVQTITINTEGTGDAVPLVVEWNQAYGSATSDLEILVFNDRGRLVGTATNASSGEPTNPYAEFDFTKSGTYFVAIENLSGPDPSLIKEITEGDGLPASISDANSGTVVGHAMASGAISAGAVSAADTPAFGVNPAQSETFSSSGAGTELLFADNGTMLSAPDVLAPVAVSGVDDIATTVSGDLSDFYGTSAAAASLAGVAALILSANPDLTPAQVEHIVEETALPMGNSTIGGAGLAQVDPAVAAADAFETQPPTLVNDNPFMIVSGTTQTITSNLLGASDDVSSGSQLLFTLTTAPADGAILLNGALASSFTQADIDNGLVSYHETATDVTSDSFLFTVTDAAGNVTGTNSFQISIEPVFSGDRSDYQMTYNSATQMFTVTDERPGSPDGTHSLSQVQQFQFADGSSTYSFNTAGALASETFNNVNGSHWVNTFDTVGNQTWAWEVSTYDGSGNLMSQTGLNHDGTHFLTLYDVSHQYSWTTATIDFDANWSETSITGTDASGSHSLISQNVAAAYDTTLWYATPFDTIVNQAAVGTAVASSTTSSVVGHSGNDPGGQDGFVFNFSSMHSNVAGNQSAQLEFGEGAAGYTRPSGTTHQSTSTHTGNGFTLENTHTAWMDSDSILKFPGFDIHHASEFSLS